MRIMFFSFVTLVLLSTFTSMPKQETMPMCHTPEAIAEFATLADDPAFRAAHTPDILENYKANGKMIEFPTSDGQNGKGYLVKPDVETNKYLLLLHEWWGLNDNTKREADEWCKELKINVLALDLYDGKLATNPEEAGKYMQANDATRSGAIIKGAAKYAGKKADFRTMGWCFGGGWSLQTALLLKKKTKACVMYYGMPESDVKKLKKLNSDVIFIHANKDKWINDEVVATFEANMKSAKKTLTVHRYDADHAFANPTSPRYHEASAKASREVVKAYLMDK